MLVPGNRLQRFNVSPCKPDAIAYRILWQFFTQGENSLEFGSAIQCALPDSSFTRVWFVIQFASQVLPPSSTTAE